MEEKSSPTCHHRAVREIQGGTHLAEGVLLHLREGRGAESGVTKTVFVKVTNTLHLTSSKGHFPGCVAQPSWEYRCDRSLPSPRGTPLPSPGVPPPALVLFLTASLLLFSGDVVVLPPCAVLTHPVHTSAQPPGPLHGSVSQPLRVRCPEVNSGYPLPASKFLHLVPAIHSGYSSLIFSFSLILCTACISQAQWLSAPPNISSSSTSLLLYPMLEGDCCLPPGQVQCLLNYFPIITASCMEWLSSQIHVHNLDQTCPF